MIDEAIQSLEEIMSFVCIALLHIRIWLDIENNVDASVFSNRPLMDLYLRFGEIYKVSLTFSASRNSLRAARRKELKLIAH